MPAPQYRSAGDRERPSHPASGALKEYTMYQLMFEVVARIKETQNMSGTSARQCLIVGRACMEELSKRAMKREE